MEELRQDSGVGKDDGETESNTLPQFLCSRDTPSDSLMVSLEKGKFSYETGLNAESLAHIGAHDNRSAKSNKRLTGDVFRY